MFEFTRNFYVLPEEGGSESSFTPGQIIIPEQIVEIVEGKSGPIGEIVCDYKNGPDALSIMFDGIEYIVPKSSSSDNVFVYGEMDAVPSFQKYPFCITYGENDLPISFNGWAIYTPTTGGHTISAKVPGAAPKVLSFPKGRTIVSELSRLNKAFGTVSKKKTIIGQLSDLADAAEAGKIGGGSGNGKEYGLIEFIFSNPSQVTINPGETVTLELVCNNEEFLNYDGYVIISNVRSTFTLYNYIIVNFPCYNPQTRHLFVNIYNKSSETAYGLSTFSINAFGLIEFEDSYPEMGGEGEGDK